MSDGEHSELTDTKTRAGAAGIVLVTLAAGQFLMTLDSSVMNVSIATVAKDVGTTVTGIQTAITFYTLVMASLMITGGKVGQILGRKRAFAIGCVIYGCGSFTTAVAPLPLVIWSSSPPGGAGTSSVTVPVIFDPGVAEAGKASVSRFWAAIFAMSTSTAPRLGTLGRSAPPGAGGNTSGEIVAPVVAPTT